jgi:hypothetical protein
MIQITEAEHARLKQVDAEVARLRTEAEAAREVLASVEWSGGVGQNPDDDGTMECCPSCGGKNPGHGHYDDCKLAAALAAARDPAGRPHPPAIAREPDALRTAPPPVTTQLLLDAGMNAFAAQLLAESFLKLAAAPGEHLAFAYRGVWFRLQFPYPSGAADRTPPPAAP